ncbi:MAG: insulinase family protein [Oscillospiraceae bacterium]|jgi:predicted Zn-dependent peptidase|nr:insulinase family protein [Oscillospiraceae bacterium]
MYEIVKLQNGLRLISEHIPHVRSVSVGLWIGTGSMHEHPKENGLSHFLEHMLFKGTERRSARDIAESMDAIGGQINAFTSKECTCFYAKVIDEHLNVALDVLSDLALNATLTEAELNKERGVILEEIAMLEDAPEDLVHDLLLETVFQGNPLAQPILGRSTGIAAYTRDDLYKYRAAHYRPNNCVVSIAGNFPKDALSDLVEKYLGGWKSAEPPTLPEAAACFHADHIARTKDIEQIHLCLGFPGVPLGSDDVYPMSILNNLFGGGMSSRLFQRIREELGMAYSVYSYPTTYPGCGLFTMYAGTSMQHVEMVLDQLHREAMRLMADGIRPEEFDMAREQLKGSIILGLESSSSRMSNIGRSLLLLGRVRTEEQVLAAIAKVTPDDVMRIAGETLLKPHGVSVVGREAERMPLEWLKG